MSGLSAPSPTTSTANALYSVQIRANARDELEQLRSEQLQNTASHLIRSPTLNSFNFKVSADRLNGWSIERGMITSVSAPALHKPRRRLDPPLRFRQQPAELAARKDSSPMPSPRREQRSPRRDGNALVGSSPRRNRRSAALAGSAVFLAPQRTTSLAGKGNGERFDCCQPGYYDFSPLSAPWTLAGQVKQPDKLSAIFLAPGRSLEPVSTFAGESGGDRGSGVGGSGGHGGRGPNADAPQLLEKAAGGSRRSASKNVTRGSTKAERLAALAAPHGGASLGGPSQADLHRLARKERELEKLQVLMKSEAKRERAEKAAPSPFKSPAYVAEAEKSFEQRLLRATNVPRSEKAIAQLLSRPTPPDFLADLVRPDSAGRTLTGPHVSGGTLALKSNAFSNASAYSNSDLAAVSRKAQIRGRL